MTEKFKKYIAYIAKDIFSHTEKESDRFDDQIGVIEGAVWFPFGRIHYGDLNKSFVRIESLYPTDRFLDYIHAKYGATGLEADAIWHKISVYVMVHLDSLPEKDFLN